MFVKGEIVVCVDTDPNPRCQPNPWTLGRLKKGRLYRVADYLPHLSMAGVTLIGVDNRPGDGWQAWRFRKVEPAHPVFLRELFVRRLEQVS